MARTGQTPCLAKSQNTADCILSHGLKPVSGKRSLPSRTEKTTSRAGLRARQNREALYLAGTEARPTETLSI